MLLLNNNLGGMDDFLMGAGNLTKTQHDFDMKN